MKRIIFVLLLLMTPGILSLANAQTQQRGKFNPMEFKAKLENFITQEVGFNTTEAQDFFPIYFEMKSKQRQLQRNICQLKEDAQASNASDNDFAISIQKIKEMDVEMAQLGVVYYKKMCNVVSPRKVYAAMQAEDRFHRQMLENFGHGRFHNGHKNK